MRKILSLAILGLMFAAPAFAQDATTAPVTPAAPAGDGVRKELRQDIHKDRAEMKADVQAGDKKAAAGEVKEIRKEKVDLRKDRRGDRKHRRTK